MKGDKKHRKLPSSALGCDILFPMKKSIVIACGGTGGHIHPALAIAEALKADGHTVSLILSGTRTAEKPTAAAWEGPLLLSGARPIKDPRNVLAVLKSYRFLKKHKPDLLFTTGGYTCFPPVVAARLLKIPVVMHEANALPGKAVRWLSRKLKIEAVATSFEETNRLLPHTKTVFTGLPLRKSIVSMLEQVTTQSESREGFSILVTGGSQGARGMNFLVGPVLASLAQSDPKVRITHQCGPHDLEWAKQVYEKTPNRVEIVPFISEMAKAYSQADIVIARAGAATCFEIARCAIPAIFIPLPTAADDHQRKNAEALVACGGALCVDQLTTTAEQFADIIQQLYSDPSLRTSMHDALKRLPKQDATRSVCNLITETLAKN